MFKNRRQLFTTFGKNKLYVVLIGVCLVAATVVAFAFLLQQKNTKYIASVRTVKHVSPTSLPPLSPLPTVTIKTKPSATSIPSRMAQAPNASSNMIFGIGSQAGPAMDFRLVKEAPVRMLTSWYNGTKDLTWMKEQKTDLIPRLYAHKYIVHLITWTDLPEEDIQTPHGPACGRPYPVSTQVVEDMKQLAETYYGDGPMYVTLFTEFQTYTCTDNNWIGNENYYTTLKDNFRKIKDIFHQYAPQSKVAISWGGWQIGYDDTVNKGGRSFFPYFADIIRESDFAAFQAMESHTNIEEIKGMTRLLGSYGKPVMLAHYKPANGSQDVFQNDMRTLFTDEIMQELKKKGLFAISFMDNEMLENESSYQIVREGVVKYGK